MDIQITGEKYHISGTQYLVVMYTYGNHDIDTQLCSTDAEAIKVLADHLDSDVFNHGDIITLVAD